MDPLFDATAYAIEEVIINAMVAAENDGGRDATAASPFRTKPCASHSASTTARTERNQERRTRPAIWLRSSVRAFCWISPA